MILRELFSHYEWKEITELLPFFKKGQYASIILKSMDFNTIINARHLHSNIYTETAHSS